MFALALRMIGAGLTLAGIYCGFLLRDSVNIHLAIMIALLGLVFLIWGDQ